MNFQKNDIEKTKSIYQCAIASQCATSLAVLIIIFFLRDDHKSPNTAPKRKYKFLLHVLSSRIKEF